MEDLSNSVVFENRPVLVSFISQSDLASLELRKGTEREGEIRVVEVEGFDSIPCGGTHVRTAGEVGPIKVTRWARRSGDVRVEFLCGWRALRRLPGEERNGRGPGHDPRRARLTRCGTRWTGSFGRPPSYATRTSRCAAA